MEHYVEMGGTYTIKGEKIFGRRLYVKPSEIDSTRKRFNNTDVYCTAFRYDNEDQDKSDLIGPFYLDLDFDIKNNSDFAKIKRDLNFVLTALETQFCIPKSIVRLYFSGHKGFHIIVPEEVIGAMPNKELNIYYKAMADKLKKLTLFKTVDTRIYDNKRLLRLPNSINSKTGLYKVPMTYNKILTSTYDDIKEYASQPKVVLFPKAVPVSKAVNAYKEFVEEFKRQDGGMPRTSRGSFKISTLPKCMEAVLENGAQQGKRNNTAVILANCLYQMNIPLDKALERMQKWNEEKNVPKLSKSEIVSVTSSGYREGGKSRHYGCSAIKDLDLCVEGACKYKK